jgi:predicted secreted acid phosphatase
MNILGNMARCGLPLESAHVLANLEKHDSRKEQIEAMFREVYPIVCLVGNNV